MGARRAFVTGSLVALLPACVLFTNFDELSEPVPATSDGAAPATGPISDAGGADARADVLTDGPSRYRDAILADGPIVYWRMDVSGGGTVRDETGRGNDLVVEDVGAPGPGALAGDPSRALSFDGKASKAHATNSAPLAFNGNAPFTIELWLERIPFSQHEEFQQIIDHAATPGGAAAAVGYYLYYSRNEDRLAFLRRGSGEPTLLVAPVSAMPANVYIHFAVTYDGSTLRAMIDGTIVSTVSATDAVGERNSDFILGWNGAGRSFYPGLIDELAVYDRALTLAELSSHRQAALGP